MSDSVPIRPSVVPGAKCKGCKQPLRLRATGYPSGARGYCSGCYNYGRRRDFDPSIDYAAPRTVDGGFYCKPDYDEFAKLYEKYPSMSRRWYAVRVGVSERTISRYKRRYNITYDRQQRNQAPQGQT